MLAPPLQSSEIYESLIRGEGGLMFTPDWAEFALDGSSRSAQLVAHLRTVGPDRQWPASLKRMSPRIAKLPFYNKTALLSFEPYRGRSARAE